MSVEHPRLFEVSKCAREVVVHSNGERATFAVGPLRSEPIGSRRSGTGDVKWTPRVQSQQTGDGGHDALLGGVQRAQ